MAGITHQGRVGQGSLVLALGLTLVLFDVRVADIDVLHDIAGGLLVLIGSSRLVAGIEEAGWAGGMVVVTAGLVFVTTVVGTLTEAATLTRLLTVAASLVFPSLAVLMRDSLRTAGRHRLADYWTRNLTIVTVLVVPAAAIGVFFNTLDSTTTLVTALVLSAGALIGFIHTLLGLVTVWAARQTLEPLVDQPVLSNAA